MYAHTYALEIVMADDMRARRAASRSILNFWIRRLEIIRLIMHQWLRSTTLLVALFRIEELREAAPPRVNARDFIIQTESEQ